MFESHSLESRCLLSATAIAPIPAANVPPGAPTNITLSTYFKDPQVTGTAVEIQTPEGNIPLALTDSATPKTVANFLSYINAGEYSNVLIHRLAAGFVIQGGGFQPDGTENPTFAPVPSEAGQSNVAGTIAMALTQAGANSGTDQWFINLSDNSSALDGNADGGPFTAFGSVIYNGMSVADAIGGLQAVDDSAQFPQYGPGGPNSNNPFTQLPVTPAYTGSNPASSVPVADMIVTTTIVVPALSYSVTDSNPAVASAAINNGTLTITPAAGVTSGSTNVSITATDLGGGTVTSTFAVNVTDGSTLAVNVGSGAAKSITYKDSDGTTGAIALKGPGQASVLFSGSNLAQTTNKNGTVTITSTSASISSITTSNTAATSNLTLTTKGGTKQINVGDITTDSLKSITGKGVNLAGTLSATGGIGSVSIASANGGAITLPSIGTFSATGNVSDNITLSGTGLDLAKFSAGSITGGTWLVSGSVKTITAGSVSNWSPDFTGSVSSMTVNKGDLSAAITAGSIGTIHVRGNLSSATIQLTGAGSDLGNLSVNGQITGSLINAVGNLGKISAATLTNSQIYAGIAALPSGQILPNFPSDFATNQAITSVKLKTARTGDSFFNSAIAAQTLGTLSLGTVLQDNGGITEGVASEDIKSLTGIFGRDHANLKNITSATDTMTILAKENVELGDFVLKLF
ncbi:MAG TPA: peptidylprolyl isomerase [Tepidisphaeraceae bacterium]|nr:peptidylprolyl isomerase [Tepidisphaeraceae bacterium]